MVRPPAKKSAEADRGAFLLVPFLWACKEKEPGCRAERLPRGGRGREPPCCKMGRPDVLLLPTLNPEDRKVLEGGWSPSEVVRGESDADESLSFLGG